MEDSIRGWMNCSHIDKYIFSRVYALIVMTQTRLALLDDLILSVNYAYINANDGNEPH